MDKQQSCVSPRDSTKLPVDKETRRKEICRAYYERHCEKLRAKSAQYYKDNKERCLERSIADKEKLKEYSREYRKANRDKVNATQRAYRARKKAEALAAEA